MRRFVLSLVLGLAASGCAASSAAVDAQTTALRTLDCARLTSERSQRVIALDASIERDRRNLYGDRDERDLIFSLVPGASRLTGRTAALRRDLARLDAVAVEKRCAPPPG